MKLSSLPVLVVFAALLAPAAPGQTREENKQELAERETAATDPESLMELARWAGENELRTDYKRLLNKVIGLDPDHEEARQALGYVRHDGDWMLRAKRDLMVKKQREAAFEAQGLTKVQGVWVGEDEVADAEAGIFHHEGETVTREEKLALMEGKVRHPITGAFIAAEDLEKANQALYPTGDSWVEWAEADEYHADPSRPWVWRTRNATVVTNLSIQHMEDVVFHVDEAIDAAKLFFQGTDPSPAFRPTILVCSTVPMYQDVGNAIGAETSVYGAFVAEQAPQFTTVTLGQPPAVANFGEQQPWGTYYLRHAAGLAYAQTLGRSAGARLPGWLLSAVGSLVERHSSPDIAKFFAQQHLASGGIRGLESWGYESLEDWFGGFRISSELASDRIAHNIFQAGLLLDFAMRARDAEATAAAGSLVEALRDRDGEAVDEAVKAFRNTLGAKETELRAFLKQVIEGN